MSACSHGLTNTTASLHTSASPAHVMALIGLERLTIIKIEHLKLIHLCYSGTSSQSRSVRGVRDQAHPAMHPATQQWWQA